MANPLIPIAVGDVVSLRKEHPCGKNRWEITRVGADVKLKCCGCGRYVMVDRAEFNRRYKAHLESE